MPVSLENLRSMKLSPFISKLSESKMSQDQFNKFALMQSLEYDFEHILDGDSEYQNDDDIVDQFCDDTLFRFQAQ